jgi:hypothetical protein
MATVQPIDYAPIYDKVIGEYANDRGILPPELQRMGYGALSTFPQRRQIAATPRRL